MTAYEELKAWCEKHLPPMEYHIVPESNCYNATIYFGDGAYSYFTFDSTGGYLATGDANDDDLIDHIHDYEATKGTQ
jgi:hypothetical protein